jgi:hypothetical protein
MQGVCRSREQVDDATIVCAVWQPTVPLAFRAEEGEG